MDKIGTFLDDLAERTRALVGMGNVRRLIVTHGGREVVNLPLTVAVVVGAVVLVANAPLALLGIFVALVLGVRARIEGGA